MICPLWLPESFSGSSASQLWLAVMNWAKWLNFLASLIKMLCFQNQLNSFHLILKLGFVSDGKKRFIFALFRIFHFNVSVSPCYFGGGFFRLFFHWKNHQRFFFLMVGKHISQLLNPFKLYIRKSLGTRTLLVLFSPFPLAFSMFSVGENEGKEGKTLSESWCITEGTGS